MRGGNRSRPSAANRHDGGMSLRIQCLDVDCLDPARVADFWQEALGVRLVIGTPEERLARKARQELIDQIAAFETPAEYDERTGDSMSGDDAIATLVSMIESARRLSKHDASQTFHFKADVPGHAAPEGCRST